MAGDVIALALEYQYYVVLIFGFLGAFVHYRQTGKLPLGRLPWQAIKRTAQDITTKYFKRPRPTDKPGLLVHATPTELDFALRTLYFESGDLYSYEYDGEVLNLRRPNGYNGELSPMELHTRVFKTDESDVVLMLAHDEASRFESWGDHIRGSDLSWVHGRNHLKAVLDRSGITYSSIESEEVADIEVIT